MSTHEQLLDAFKKHEHFVKAMLDAYALIDCNGKVLKCNQLLSSMVGQKSRQILKSDSLDQIISLDIDGKNISVKDFTTKLTPTRVDEVGCYIISNDEANTDQDSAALNLIIGIYPFLVDEKVIGTFLLIRDVTAETNLQGKYKDKAKQSITDKLTGLYNRSYFDSYLPSLLKNSRDLDSLSIIMADIDHFKSINDTYGHQAGDYILEKVSANFRSKFRKTDVVCRYGGEEFLAILPSTNAAGAIKAAEKLRIAVESDTYEYDGKTMTVTISLGIAEAVLGTDSDKQIIERADNALYHSKDNGRNCVSIYQPNGQITTHTPDNLLDSKKKTS